MSTGIEIVGLIASVLQLAQFLWVLTSRRRQFWKFLTQVGKTLKTYMDLVREEKSPIGKIVKSVKAELKKAQKQLAGFSWGLVSRIRNPFGLTSRCRQFSKFLTLVEKTLKIYMDLVREEKSPIGEIVKAEVNKAQKLVSDLQGKKVVQRCLSAYKFPKKLKESEEAIWRFLNLLPLATGPTVQVTPAEASTSKARKTARATPATNRGRGQPPKAPASGSSGSRAQQALLPTPPEPARASTSKARKTARATPATNRGHGQPPKAPASGSSGSRAQQVLLPTPPAPASASRAPLGTPPAPASASRSPQGPLQTPPAPASASKGKEKAVAFDHKRIATPATNRGRGQPPKAPASGSSGSRAQQVLLPTPPAPASASRAPLGTPPAPASASRSPQGPLQTPPALASASKGKEKAVAFDHKRIKGNQ